MTTDKRELYKTAVIARSGAVFQEGEYVSVSVLHRMEGGWVFHCRNGERTANYSEGFLREFCL